MLDFVLFLLLMMLVILIFIIVEMGDITNKFKREMDFAGGKGTREDPYLISSQEHLHNVRYHLDRHFRQTADIDLKNYCRLRGFSGGWQPLGNEDSKFRGSYDGQGHLIKNLRIEAPDSDCLGLFGAISGDSLLENIELENVDIIGRNRVGGLVGVNEGRISDCRGEGDIRARRYVGGIAGSNRGELENCEFRGVVRGMAHFGEISGG